MPTLPSSLAFTTDLRQHSSSAKIHSLEEFAFISAQARDPAPLPANNREADGWKIFTDASGPSSGASGRAGWGVAAWSMSSIVHQVGVELFGPVVATQWDSRWL